MYSTIFESKKIKVSNEAYRLLLKRFDRSKFIANKPVEVAGMVPYQPHMVNDTPCALCESFRCDEHDARCGRCPLRSFEHGFATGCGYVINQLLIGESMALNLTLDATEYNIWNEAIALGNLHTITKFLKSFKKE